MSSNQGPASIAGATRPSTTLMLRAVRAVAAALSLLAWLPAQAETVTGEVGGFRYRLLVPEAGSSGSPSPLLVVLHGCKQSAAEIARLSGFDALAEAEGFAVLYPETGPSADNPYGCWRWWAPENQIRPGGEPGVIVDMVSEAAFATRLDRLRVYAVGLSSGGAMSAILGTLYPDVFAAVGVHSGLPYAAAGSGACALRAISDPGIDPESRATIAYHAQGRRKRPMPLMVIHGEQDDVVAPENAGLLIRQFAQLNDLADDGDGGNQSVDATADAILDDRIADGRSFRIRVYHDARDKEIMRQTMVSEMGHAWSGGTPGAGFSDPKGPDAASFYWGFFMQQSLNEPPLTSRPVATCRERYGTNFGHYWWFGRMTSEEYRCDPWGWSWRRGYDGEWTGGRCP